MKFTIPIRTASGDNQREHWSKRHRRIRKLREATAWAWLGLERYQQLALPIQAEIDGVRVKLTRIAPCALDGHDGLQSSMKAVADELTAHLGLPNDRDPRIKFEYDQRRGKVREYAVEVEILPC